MDSHKMDSKTWAVPKSNTMMRSYFARTGRTPTVAQIRENLGSLIADALFASIPIELRESIGLEPKLKGPTESMWNSPSDQLLGKLKLGVVPSQRHAHAMTHRAILEIGEDIQEMVIRMNEEELGRKLEEQQKMFEHTLKERVKDVRKKVIREFYILSSFKMRELFNRMEADFKEEWKKRENYLLTEAEKERVEGIRLLEEAMECELDNLTRLHEDKFKSQLKFLVNWEKSDAHDEYHLRLMVLQKKWAQLFRDTQEAEKKKMQAQIDEIRAQYEAEFWSTITTEREYADKVLYEVVKFGKSQLTTLDDEIIQLRDKFEQACQKRNEYAEDIESWKSIVHDLFNQFQKFITFVLKEIPGQAEYLLSLSEIIKNRKECLPRGHSGIDRHRYMGHQKEKVESWDEALVRHVDKAKDTELYEWKSEIDLDDEDDDRRRRKDEKKEDEYLKELAKGKQNDDCVEMIKKMSQWVLDKVDNLQITPSVSSLKSSESEIEQVQESELPIIDPEVLQYAKFMEKIIPTSPSSKLSHKGILEANSESEKIITRTSIKDASGHLEFPDPCPEPFVAKRITSILDILDAHPTLKLALNES